MKLIEPTPKTVEKDTIGKAVDQVKQLFRFGKTDEYAEEAIVAKFMRGLDNRFIMLRNLQIAGNGEIFQPVLVGPAGMFVLNISHIMGFFRAKEDSWLEMNKTTRKYAPSRPNLIKESKEIAQKLEKFLDKHGKPHPAITPLLIFANAGANIERSNPAIRIVLMDGVDSLVDSLRYSDEVLQQTEIMFLSDTLEIMANPEKEILEKEILLGEGEDFFGKDLLITEKKAPLTLPDIPLPTELPLPPIEEKLKFSQKQWTILVVLLLLTIVVLFVAILFALGIF
jgi:Nuclease-related domain